MNVLSSHGSKAAGIACLQGLAVYCVTCLDSEPREGAWKIFTRLLQAFRPSSRYDLYQQLLSMCPYSNVTAALVDMARLDCVRAWNMTDNAFSPTKMIHLLLSAFERTLEPGDWTATVRAIALQ